MGNLGHNAFRGPDLLKLEFRGEVYNLTNTSNYNNPIGLMTAPLFGRSFSLFNGAGGRQFQVGGRFLF